MSNNDPEYEYRLTPEYEYGPDSRTRAAGLPTPPKRLTSARRGSPDPAETATEGLPMS